MKKQPVVLSRNERRRIESAVEIRTRAVDAVLKDEQRRSAQLKTELDQAAKRDADRLSALAQKDEAIRIANENTANARAERDRLIRMVDQFTSVSIVPFGNGVDVSNLPKSLRRT